jgi:predicted RNA-binding Zn-ribbon protein involved in translation (DUF1610 family)
MSNNKNYIPFICPKCGFKLLVRDKKEYQSTKCWMCRETMIKEKKSNEI